MMNNVRLNNVNERIKINDQWVKVEKRKNSKLQSDKVYAAISAKVKNLLCITLGRDVTELLGITDLTRVDVFLNPRDKDAVMIKKAGDIHGYKLCKAKGSTFLRFQFVVPESMALPVTLSKDIKFEVYADGSIVLNLAALRT